MNSELPRNWENWRLADVGTWYGGGTPTSSEPAYWDGQIPWVSPKDMKSSKISTSIDKITDEAVANSAAKIIPSGAVLFVTRSGILAHSFPVAVTEVPVTVNQDLKAIRPLEAVDPNYIAWVLRANAREILSTCSKHGTTVHSIEIPRLRNLSIAIPPLNEQRRIVAKIEELFSELDKGVESLAAAREQLKAYRQSVFKAAFDGRLCGATLSENSLWPMCGLGDSIEFLTSGSRGWADYYSDQGDIFIRAQNLKHDRLDLADIAFVKLPEGSTEGVRTRVRLGDLLITITGANVTKTGLVDRELGSAYVSQHVALCRLKSDLMPEYLYWYLLSEAGGRKQLIQAAYGAGKPGLNLDNIRSILVPKPSLPEQASVIAEIKRSIEAELRLESEIDAALSRTKALRQSILMNAFSGQLVAQNAGDEPASVLLGRIRVERENSGTTKRRKYRNGKKEAA